MTYLIYLIPRPRNLGIVVRVSRSIETEELELNKRAKALELLELQNN